VSWRLAKAIAALRAECDALAPLRNRISDGTIGDEAHASRDSDHNPYIIDSAGQGVVRAIDVTHDPAGGMDCNVLAEFVRTLYAGGDNRGRYVIWNRRIASASSSPAWSWRPYTGDNPHDKHAHISVSEDPRGYDSTAPWGVPASEEEEEDVNEQEHAWLQNANAFTQGGANAWIAFQKGDEKPSDYDGPMDTDASARERAEQFGRRMAALAYRLRKQ
jgi:hypothetical protein